jgi:hypothetical protein
MLVHVYFDANIGSNTGLVPKMVLYRKDHQLTTGLISLISVQLLVILFQLLYGIRIILNIKLLTFQLLLKQHKVYHYLFHKTQLHKTSLIRIL